MHGLLSTYGLRGTSNPWWGFSVWSRALGAEVRVCAPDFAVLLARVDVPLVPIGPPLRPPVTGATPPSAGVAPPARCRVGLPPSSTPSPRRPGNVIRRSRPA
jgi:hypothetical protein